MKTANCPECNLLVTIQDHPTEDIPGMQELDIVDCDECGSELKIMSLEPLAFEVVMMERDTGFESFCQENSEI
jgi:hypothetical protein